MLRNQRHTLNGHSKQAVEFFESKIKDALFFGDIKRAVAARTDVILLNIDSKADHRTGRDLILEPFDILVLQALFLIRYVEEMKGNVDNLVTLCLDRIDADRLALRRRIEESLARLEKETLISRSGDLYFFLTNEERDINKEIKEVDLLAGEEAKLLGEILFEDVLRGQRKHRFSANRRDFDFNRRCDGYPIGNQKDGALLVSVITPLADDYDTYVKEKCILTTSSTGPEGGFVLIRLDNDESLGRELRTFLQTDKYIKRKDDGTLAESTKNILRKCSQENQSRRERLVKLLGEMLTEAEYFVAGQPLKIKATTPQGMLEEAMEYLIQNTFSKMSYLKRLATEPLKEIQAVLRSTDVAKEMLLFQSGENNPQASDDVRNYVELCAKASRQVVLHDMIEKRYALRPYGWPDDEVCLLVARLLVLGEISLMMDGALLPIGKVYENITAPARRRKIVVFKRQISDPKAIQNARNLGKELFAEMGPDGEDALFAFLQGKLKDWQANLNTYRTLAETGNYPGAGEITDGLTLMNKLLADQDSCKFIERYNTLRKDLLDFAEIYHDLEHFHDHQKPTREKLRRANEKFQLNRLELERDAQAGTALKRIGEILAAPAPYGLPKDAEGFTSTVQAVNSALLTARRQEAVQKIDRHYGTLTRDIAAVGGDPALRACCLRPLETLKQQIERQESLAHVTQAEGEALRCYDEAVKKIENHETHETHEKKNKEIKKQTIVKPAEFVEGAHLETTEEVGRFLSKLRTELEAAIERNEHIVIR